MDQIIYHSFSITDFLMEHRIFYFYINKKEEQEACRNNFKFYSFIGVILYVFLELRVIIIYIHLSPQAFFRCFLIWITFREF